VVKHVGRKNKWYLQTDPSAALTFDLCWTDNHVKAELFARMHTHQKINHFPGMTILSRKNNLGNALMLFRKRFPGDYDFFPITWSLPNDYPDLLAYHECRQQGKAQTFIVKPEASCQGRGIYLTRNIESSTFFIQKSSTIAA
jgi:tubulin polyglutamylase TTLL6/13